MKPKPLTVRWGRSGWPRLQEAILLGAEARDGGANRTRSDNGASGLRKKPRLLVEPASPDLTVAGLRNILSGAPDLFCRGVPVRLASDRTEKSNAVAQVMKPDDLVLLAHQVCRPFALTGENEAVDVRLPTLIAKMYLGWRGEWRLRPLNGITSAPLLRDDGTIISGSGYDSQTGMWREDVPDLTNLVPAHPTFADAATTLRIIRETFKTFCFADASIIESANESVPVVDVQKPPGRDESAFLTSLLTAVCRPSLPLAPAVLLRAAPMSGAGTGKGLLARCMSIIAFGREPHAVTAGADAAELEKRIAAELMQASPTLFLDNLNNTAFRSDLLASAITERPSRVRLLGRSQMIQLNATAFVVLTGNGLTISEDLARRFIAIDFDARMEDPESRLFTSDIKADVLTRRAELLASALTIWRWGRQAGDLPIGQPMGSFEIWSKWVRDPLLALGCWDPAKRVGEAKHLDTRRQAIADLFKVWSEKHGDRPVAVRDLHRTVALAADPQGRGRQFLASQLGRLAGTRLRGFVLTRQTSGGKWGAATYALKRVNGGGRSR
jgi:hypothetical protein